MIISLCKTLHNASQSIMQNYYLHRCITILWNMSTGCRRLGTSATHKEEHKNETECTKGTIPDDTKEFMDIKATSRSIKKVMVANRGEVAIRVNRSCSELGVKTVAIFSDADKSSPHRMKADEAYLVGKGKSPVDAYLDIADIVRIAKMTNTDAIHPGYGFLSEREDFAKAVLKAGIAFIGPRPKVLRVLGNKTEARKVAVNAGLTIVPGTDYVENAETALEFCKEHGLPVIIKAAHGGGGRGMRVVWKEEEVEEFFSVAQSEAKAAFGDGSMFLEKYIVEPSHIEVQILGDQEGNVIHLFERDCSIQRRHQKLIEMAPSRGISCECRDRLLDYAVKLGKYIKYHNAGTVEFLVDGNENVYFIEVNPRLQVEHTVTEEITGIDIVRQQILIAEGKLLKDLGMEQENIKTEGHAIQCRITAEDPSQNFQPSTGRIEEFLTGKGMGIRLDGALDFPGSVISGFYDSLIVKLIAKSATFEQTVAKARRALQEFRVGGIVTNIQFLINVLQDDDFTCGKRIDTSYIEKRPHLVKFAVHSTPVYSIVKYIAEIVVNGPLTPLMTDIKPTTILPSIPGGDDISTKPIPAGWRKILLDEGPEAFAKAVRKRNELLLMDTSFRDAHQSLLATRVRTYDLLKASPFVARKLNQLYSLENWGGATFDVAMRFLHECPWERLESMRKLIPNVPFQMLLRGSSAVGYKSYPDNVIYKFCEIAVKKGMDVFRVFDSLNYVPNLALGIDAVRKAGGVAEGAISYTGDITDPKKDKYDLSYYVHLSDELVKVGTHVLCIKDMAGLLKPLASKLLVQTLRERHPNVPIHVHTHDTSGAGVAAMLAAAIAGADVVDVACDSMSGMTSQPSMGAVVASLAGTSRDTKIDLATVNEYSSYWEQARLLYGPFESAVAMKSCNSEVYLHEIPGGQYTNLQFQAFSLGLGKRFEEVKQAYKEANLLLGDIVKVTPSSKVVGDLAQFMVSKKLRLPEVKKDAAKLDFPTSVVEFMQGVLGEPYGGFPEPFRTDVLKGEKTIEGRPGASMEPLDFDALKEDLSSKFPNISDEIVMSAALYPQVTNSFLAFRGTYGSVDKLDTRTFLTGIIKGESIEVAFQPGVSADIKYLASSDHVSPDGKRAVFFEVRSHLRSVLVPDKKALSKKPAHPKADKGVLGEIGAPMNGTVVRIDTKVGEVVDEGTPLLVMSAMKMEMIVRSPVVGTVSKILAKPEMVIATNDLLIVVNTSDS